MDALDRLAEPGLDLLRRVDTLIAAGVPEGHRVWPLLRRMQVLPGDAVRSFLDLHPVPLASAGHAVRRLVRGYDEVSAALTDSVLWSGQRTGNSGPRCCAISTRGRTAWSGDSTPPPATPTPLPTGWRAAVSRWPARWPTCSARPKRSPWSPPPPPVGPRAPDRSGPV